MKYNYKLVENEEPTTNSGGEESGLRKMDIPKELKLTTHGNVTADDIISILEDPKYLSTVFIDKSENLIDLEKKVFGDKPISDKFVNTNKKIYNENGVKLYKEIEKAVGKEFEKNFVIKKDENNKIMFAFPVKTSSSQDLVAAYLKIKPKTDIKPKKIDDSTLTFNTSDKKDIEKILNAAKEAKAISSKDYSLETIDKTDESKLNEDKLFNIDPKMSFQIYDILKNEVPEIGKKFATKSAFFYFLNDNIK